MWNFELAARILVAELFLGFLTAFIATVIQTYLKNQQQDFKIILKGYCKVMAIAFFTVLFIYGMYERFTHMELTETQFFATYFHIWINLLFCGVAGFIGTDEVDIKIRW